MAPRSPDYPPKEKEPLVDPEVLKAAERIAEKKESAALSIDDPYFNGRIPENDRARHKRDVESLKAKFKTTESPETHGLKVLASALEYVLADRINNGNWLGNHMRAQLTTDYDDFNAGIDMYIENTTSKEPIGVSVDITYSLDQKQLGGKIQEIKNKLLDRGKLAELTYYKPLSENTENTPARTSLSVPKVIVGVTRKRASDVITRFALGEKAPPDSLTGLFILNQTKMQLKHFIWYCERVGREKPWVMDAVPVYKRALEEQEILWQEKLTELGLEQPQFADRVKALVNSDPLTQTLQNVLDKELPLESRMAA